MKKITAHFNTGSGLVSQTFEMSKDVDPVVLADLSHVELKQVGRGKALIRIADVAFWTYD